MPHEVKIVIAGNHDLTLDTSFYEQYGVNHHYLSQENHLDCQSLLTNTDSLIYLLHHSCLVRLRNPNGPHTEFTVFGSPHTPEYGLWAFMYPRHQSDGGVAASRLWDQIPLDTDVLVTHGPAFGHLDETSSREAAGCEELRKAMWRVRPRLALCGHIHEARGAEKVRWDLGSNESYKEVDVQAWDDPAPAGEKICLIDLTSKRGNSLDNDGSGALREDMASFNPQLRMREGENLGLSTRGLGRSTNSAQSNQGALAGRLGRRETCMVNCSIQTTSYPHSGPRGMNKAIVVDLDLPVWE
jgi:hypothetical protein